MLLFPMLEGAEAWSRVMEVRSHCAQRFRVEKREVGWRGLERVGEDWRR